MTHYNKIIGIVGLGCVGSAMKKSFINKNINIIGYDKYKNGGIGKIDDILLTDIIFLCLPTLFNGKEYDKNSINDTCKYLNEKKYKGLVVLKSTVEPGITKSLAQQYNIHIIHNPEFLTARTAYEDYHNQKHIVIGTTTCNINPLISFYEQYYPDAHISVCTSTESECMKIFVNSFYASKIQIFNEYYLLCKKMNIDYNKILQLMLQNKWINPMHTTVPGTDKKLSYGGMCFPKDTNALLQHMKKYNTPCMVLENVVKERDSMRNDHVYNI